MEYIFHGPLRRCSANPRYFTDDTGEAIYLTGSHTWSVFQDHVDDAGNLIDAFDYPAFLDFMEAHHHNFLRFWCREQAFGAPFFGKTYPVAYCEAGKAEDGHPLYDLTKLNPEYFQRLRDRVILAGKRGIYVSVMLFDGWGVDTRSRSPFAGHPYNKANNINGIDGNPKRLNNGTALSGENDINPFDPQEHIVIQTLEDPKITELQKAYVKKVIETLNDLDHVMFEICNEGLRWTRYWQYEMIDFIKETEKNLPKQHPVWMSHLVTAQNEALLVSHADAISPGEESTEGPYCIDPPVGDGRQVIFADTDHLGGIWGTSQWVWKSFLRGLNPIFMDTYNRGDQRNTTAMEGPLQMLFGRVQYGLPENWQEPVRVALGQTRKFAEKINLTRMVPVGRAISSTGYCLADHGEEYLVYQPECGQFKLKLYGASGPFQVEWFNPQTGETFLGETFPGGTAIDFTPPFVGEAVLYLYRKP